ncbi:hypothetical protein [Vibrio quintilis]|uniref:Uncharacterized protein n=1 Tax=Vibrio quintilis TaxID=1117707 RepID=A0A1M7YYU3_9VIBR|nr:hypothetical protein [Vibrio quintilis]SHO57754.1 hypothetical protein VQ7734_03524 [Vibrio quintilis]
MGLVTNFERWELSFALGRATEGVRGKNNDAGVNTGRSHGASDIEIGAKLDSGKVLAAVDRMAAQAPHLADWSLFAYASPMWNANRNKERLFEHVLNDWVVAESENGKMIQHRTFERIKALIEVIAGALALEQSRGAGVEMVDGEVRYKPVSTKAFLIHVLVDVDCAEKEEDSDTFRNKRKRYYQNHWADWAKHVETLRTLLTGYDLTARKIFKKELANKNGAIYTPYH